MLSSQMGGYQEVINKKHVRVQINENCIWNDIPAETYCEYYIRFWGLQYDVEHINRYKYCQYCWQNVNISAIADMVHPILSIFDTINHQPMQIQILIFRTLDITFTELLYINQTFFNVIATSKPLDANLEHKLDLVPI